MIDKAISEQPVKVKLSAVIALHTELNRCVNEFKASPNSAMRARIEVITFCLTTLDITMAT